MRLPNTFALIQIQLLILLGICAAIPCVPASAQIVPSRVIEHVDDAKLVRLPGNTQTSARPANDRGLLDPNKQLDRIMLVLKRSPEQEKALTAFGERQYDPQSPDFHHWLSAEEFGQLYGPSDSDIAQITSWLQNHGFSIFRISKGRLTIEFSGTVAQVQEAFHLEMHNYLVNGKMHIANDRDPSIPAALLPVVTGILSLHDFFPTRATHPKVYIKRDAKTGKYSRWKPETEALSAETQSPASPEEPGYYITPDSKLAGEPTGIHSDFVFSDPNVGTTFPDEVLAPYDVATIYNILPLWNESTPINGKGVSVAIVGYSDVVDSDFNTFRSSFGLPPSTLMTLHDGADPGVQTTGSEGENTLDVEMVSSTAPGAQVILVSNVSTATTDGLAIGINYIVENNIAPILTMSYLNCELGLGTTGNAYWSGIFQQATIAGITPLTCSDDAGSAGCTSQDGTPPYGDSHGLQVSGMTSTPFVTSVGGSDLQWYLGDKPASTYWNTTNNPTTGASAKGYMPEMAWNTSCTNPLLLGIYTSYSTSEALCNAAITGSPYLVGMGSGGGGVSHCTTNNTTSTTTTADLDPSSCSGGYDTPKWQTGVTGIPTDGKRHVPDVVMFGSYGFGMQTGLPLSALLVCQANESVGGSCNYTSGSDIVYEANGGTSAATPLTAGIMAMIVQKMGGAKQGLANPMLYQLAAKENYASCNSNTVAAGNSCIFYDITTGSNAMNCYTGDPDCVTNTSGDESGILSGYSAGVGYDMTTGLGSMNVTNLVNAWAAALTPTYTLSESPTALTFASTTVGSTTAAQVVTIKNTGTGAVTLTSETITGANASSFLKSATTCGTSLAAAASCTVSVEFKPASSGPLSAALSIADNATGTPQTVALTGTGATASLTYTLSESPTALTFASTRVGSTTAAQVVTIKNTGTGAVTLTSETITGTNASSFLKSATTCGTSLAVGASCTVSVEFKPAASGPLSASLSIADNATGTPQTIALSGTGAGALTYTVSLSNTSLTWGGTTAVGTTSGTVPNVTIKNTGTGVVTLSSETITGTNASSFLKSATTCGTSLAVGASCTVSIQFKPAASGPLSATLSIVDNATGSPQTVALSGTGAASATPTVTLTPATIAFPATIAGTTSDAQIVTLKNTSTVAVTLTSIVMGGTNASSFPELNTCGTSLAAGASCSIYIAFDPASAAALTGTLSVTDNATGSPQKVTVSGTGTAAPSVKLSVSSIAFPTTTHGTTSEAVPVTLTNSGTATLDLTSIALTGTNPTDFEQLNTCGATLAGSANCTVYVAFKPATAAAFTAKLTITDNGSASPQSVTLTGTGK